MGISRVHVLATAMAAIIFQTTAARAQDVLATGAQSPSFSEQASLSAHVNRGNQLMSRHQYQAALGEYEAAQKIDGQNTIVKYNLGELYNNWGSYLFRQNQYGDAEEKLKKCLKMNPGHRGARANLEFLRKTLESQGMTMSMDLDTDANHPPEPKKPEKKPEEAGKIIGSSSAAAPAIAPVGKPTLFGAGGMPGTGSFVSGSATYPTYTTKPSAIHSPVTATINPQTTRTAPPTSASAPPLQTPQASSSESYPEPTAPQSSPRAGSVEEKLSELEKRFEGCTHADWPVLKRLEQLEIKVAGQPVSGKINERIEALQKL